MVCFVVYSTCSFKYSISDPEGEIQPDSSVDIIVRHNAPTISNCGTIDKFRINTCDIITEKVWYEYWKKSLLLI